MGNTLGTVITLPVLGLIIETIGWLWAYIIPAMIACLWTLIWYFTVADSPSEHWRITDEERDYINDSLSGAVKRVKVSWVVHFCLLLLPTGIILDNPTLFENLQQHPLLGVEYLAFWKSLGIISFVEQRSHVFERSFRFRY